MTPIFSLKTRMSLWQGEKGVWVLPGRVRGVRAAGGRNFCADNEKINGK